MLARRAMPLMAATLWAGCAVEQHPAPLLYQVCQAGVVDECVGWVWAGEVVELALLGDHFYELYEVDLGTNEPLSVKSDFRAWIGGVGLQRVERSAGAVRGMMALLARLPGELAVGQHPVEVECPSGLRVVETGLFRIRNPLSVSLALAKRSLPAGDVNRLRITVANPSGTELSQVTPRLFQGGSGSFVLPAAPAPFVVAAGAKREVSLDLVAGNPGEPQVAVSVAAVAGGRVGLSTPRPIVVRSRVLRAADLVVEGRVEPPSVAMGSRVELFATASNSGGVVLRGVVSQPPVVSGDGSLVWDSSPDQIVDIPPGGEQTFRWSATAARRGTAWLQIAIVGREDISDRLLERSLEWPIRLSIQ